MIEDFSLSLGSEVCFYPCNSSIREIRVLVLEKLNSYISVIIPTLNEEDCLDKTLKRVRSGADIEVIVVDGGSVDSTLSVAQQHTNKVIKTLPSRGKQLKLGVEASKGDVILFLHADSLLPTGWDQKIRDSLKDSRIIGGAFILVIKPSSFLLYIISTVVNLRSRILGIVYGDQGIFVRRDILESIGGIKELSLFEDVDLWKRLKKKGRLMILNDYISTSSRRWGRYGVLQTTMRNWFLYFLYSIGVSIDTLYRLYYGREPVDD